jgi:hypothetical protein
MPLQDAPVQDLHVAEPVKPDVNWPAYRKPQFLQVPKGQLDKEHQLVTMRNTDKEQTHIVIDRFCVGHELQPGQAKEVDLLAEDIEYFQRRRHPAMVGLDEKGNPKLIPIVIEGIRDAPSVEQAAQQAVEAADEPRKKMRPA